VLFAGLCGLLVIASLSALEKKEYKVIIVSDTLSAWAVGIQNGFKETLDKQMAEDGAKASYQVFDTKLDPKTIPDIQAAIDKTKPDLICTINYPTVFADNQITKNPANAGYKFVSENCIPIQSGLIKDIKNPGGNVTGVGVFTRMNSMIRLAKLINPQVKKMAVNSWAAMTQVNEWFEAEFKRACKDEGLEFVEFRRVANFEESVQFMVDYDQKGREYLIADGIGSFLHKDGSKVDVAAEYPKTRQLLKNVLYLGYDEELIKSSGFKVAATAVIWNDIGAQLADQAIKVLNGTKPGDLPWEYPRKFNTVYNLAVAKNMGYTIPQNLISAAYRVYTDLEGNYVGQGK
jgi:putative ABC transport system substrate-binding protein